MVVNTSEILEVCKTLAKNKKLKHTLAETGKGMGYAGLGAGVGALLLGPLGIAAGGALGSLIGYANSDDFESLPQFIQNMSFEEKRRLVKHMEKIISDLDLEDLLLLKAVIDDPRSAKRAIFLKGVCDFFERKLV